MGGSGIQKGLKQRQKYEDDSEKVICESSKLPAPLYKFY